jgi:Protein of unknown function (DUF3237)
MRPLGLRELLSIQVRVLPLVDLGDGRRYVPFDGGTFAGRDGLCGTLREGGVDWQSVRPDGTLEIDAHYTLESEGGELVEVRSAGLRKATPDVTERLMRGEIVDPDEYYFRTHIRFNTATGRLSWLNHILAISTGRRDQAIVTIDVHEVL